jgi:hypothetical protein
MYIRILIQKVQQRKTSIEENKFKELIKNIQILPIKNKLMIIIIYKIVEYVDQIMQEK